MRKTLLFVSVLVLAAILINSCTFEKYEVPTSASSAATCDSTVHYNPTVKNIIQTNCGAPSCHGAHSTTSQLIIVSVLQGDATNVKARINGVGNIMPQTGPLAASDLSKLNCWLTQGALNN